MIDHPRLTFIVKMKLGDIDDGLLSGKSCRNSLLVPFIQGTEPIKVPNVRKKCFTKNPSNNGAKIDKIKKIFEGGQG